MKAKNKVGQLVEIKTCLHCDIVDLIMDHIEQDHDLMGHDVVDAVVTVLCEFLASVPDRDARKSEVRMIAKGIAGLTEARRKEGKYPGGQNYRGLPPQQNADAPDTLQ